VPAQLGRRLVERGLFLVGEALEQDEAVLGFNRTAIPRGPSFQPGGDQVVSDIVEAQTSSHSQHSQTGASID